jgi:uncharacterized protein YbjT (DUF2867 family)
MILVVGATGVVGGMIARQLLEQEKDVRVMVRENSPSAQMAQQGMATSAESLIDAGAEPVYGDLKDEQSLRRAVEGVQTVISSANSAMRGGEDDVQSVDREGNRRLIEAAAEAGVAHFIFISALGATLDSPNDFMRAKAEAEQALRESSMDFTIVSPTAFIEVWPAMVVGMPARQGQPVTLVGEGRRLHSFISNRDVATFAVGAVDNPRARNQFLALGGPDALSWRDVVATYERVLGHELPVNWVQPGQPVPGLPDPMPMLLAAQETYDLVVPMEETAAAYGVELTPLEAFVRQQVSG